MAKKSRAYILTDSENRLYGAFQPTKEGKLEAAAYSEKLQKTQKIKLKIKLKT